MYKIFTSFHIKVIALVLMVFDHLQNIFIDVINFPLWFHMLGRLSAPLFIFAMVNGMRHTKGPIKYLFRLYIGFLVMSIGNNIFNRNFMLPSGGILINNIFGTLFIIGLFIYCGQRISALRKEGKSYILYILIMFIPIASDVVAFLTGSVALRMFLFRFVPSVLMCEGGITWVVLGIGLYLCKSNRSLSIFYIILSLFVMLSGIAMYSGMSGEITFMDNLKALFTYNIQWMMIFSLPFMLMYNGKRGRSMKYFFYLFYPIHIYGFAFISILLAK